jgi:hypothetical protein
MSNWKNERMLGPLGKRWSVPNHTAWMAVTRKKAARTAEGFDCMAAISDANDRRISAPNRSRKDRG